MGRFKMNLRHKEIFPEYSSTESSACTVICVKEQRRAAGTFPEHCSWQRASHAPGPVCSPGFSPAAQELIRSVLLSGLRKTRSVANPWAAGGPRVAEWQPPAPSPGQPASCLQAPWLAGVGAGGGGPHQLACHSRYLP